MRYFYPLFLMTAVSVILTTIFIVQGLTFDFHLNIIPLIAFYVLVDLFQIKKAKTRLITNFAGAVPLVVFWEPRFLPFVAFFSGLFKRYPEGSDLIKKKFYGAFHYFIMYGVAVLLLDDIKNPYIALLVFALVAKLLNFVIGDLLYIFISEGRLFDLEVLKASGLELGYFIFLAIYGGLMWRLYELGLALETTLVFLLYPAIVGIVWIYVQFSNVSEERKRSMERIEGIREKLKKILEMISIVRSNPNFEEALNAVARIVNDALGYKYCMISLLDKRNNKVIRVAQSGLTEEEFDRLKSNAPPIDHVTQLLDDQFKVSRSYFIPEGAKEIDTTYAYVGDYDELLKSEAEWKPGDALIVPIVRNEEMVGYISVDAPKDGKRPQFEDIEMLEIIADQMLRIIEDSTRFREILMASKTDLATGLYTHTEFYSILEKLIESREKRFSIIMIDLDNFKEVNDTYGHIVGDQAIEKIAQVIKKSLRKEDVGARYGGDEFAIIAMDASKADAMNIAKRISREIRSTSIEKIRKRITCSMGIASYPFDGESASDLVEKADRALYAAKKAGKNKIYAI